MQLFPIVAVSPITIPMPWSINNFFPILAPGWISIPVINLAICEINFAKNNSLKNKNIVVIFPDSGERYLSTEDLF